MGLRDYLAKRTFGTTPEPRPSKTHTPRRQSYRSKNNRVKRLSSGRSKKGALLFVVQQHHASSMHFDFRLELDGVLKSWAVPKGPSLNPTDHRLAMQVEDHPYEYRTFEGVIPEGNYGAGNVIIWDQGTYAPRIETDDPEATLRSELKKGHITFIMHGSKLKGEFALVRMHDKGDKAWLLIKKSDEYASKRDITKDSRSVVSGQVVDELDVHHTRPDTTGYPKKHTLWPVKPMLSTLVDKPFDKPGWLYELKWDGYRAVAGRKGTHTELYSRNGTDFSTHYPAVYEAVRALEHNVIVDGEIVALDKSGVPHFEWLQNYRDAVRRHPDATLAYYIFDILWCDGYDVRSMPLLKRKRLLQSIVPKNSIIRYGDHIEHDGEKLFEYARRAGLEGIVAKRADSPYREDARGSDWLKIKTHQRQEAIIGGYTEPKGGRKHIGSLLVGVYRDGAFSYVGHSGGGMSHDELRTLHARLRKLERKTSPFTTEPKPNAPVHWVKPEVVCEMSFTEWTDDGYMRHPKYEGLRNDKPAVHVRHERAHTTTQETASGGPNFTHLDKVFFPEHGYTKGDIIEYYRSVAEYMLPYLADRPLSLLRQPNGVHDKGFFQKDIGHLPEWVPSIDVYSEGHGGTMHWMVGGTLETLLYAVQLGSIEINPWNSTTKHLDKPDWLVIDLDPDGSITFEQVVQVAHSVHAVCAEWNIPCYPKTSGKTGIHIFVPLGAKYTYEQARNVAHLIAIRVHEREPAITSIERTPSKRPNKIYLDYMQNRQSQTLAAPYAVRPTTDASVSMPLTWDEVVPTLRPTDFTIANAIVRLKKKGDIWKPVLGTGIDITKLLRTLS